MSPSLPMDAKCEVLTKFMNTLMVSGYDQAYRFSLIQGIMKRVGEVEAEIATQTRERFRDRETIQTMKVERQGNFPDTWFLKGGDSGLLKVQNTPGGKLLKKVKSGLSQVQGAKGTTIKAVEKAGQRLTSGLKKKARFGQMNAGCQYLVKCNVRGDKDCREARAVYQIICQTCQNHPQQPQKVVYIGTTGFTMHKRLLEHCQDLRLGNLRNALAKHSRLVHPDEEAVFAAESVESQIRYNLERFISEAIRIEMAKNELGTTLMNQKGEWGHFGISRLQVVRDV